MGMSSPWFEDRSRLAWWVLGAFLAAVLVYVVHAYVGTFVFGVFIYYATRPVYSRLKRRVRPRSLAAALSLLLLALPAILLLVYTLAIGVQETSNFLAHHDVSTLKPYIQPYINVSKIPQSSGELLTGDGLNTLQSLFRSANGYLGFIGTGALHLFLMITIAFYLLRDGNRLSRWVRRRFADDAGVFEAYAKAIDQSFHQIFFGNILNALATALIGALAYNAMNSFAPPGLPIPYPTLIGLLAGAASLIPVVGMKLVYFPATAYLAMLAFLDGRPSLLWFTVVFFVVSFVVVDTIPDLVLRPYVSGRNLHVGMVMLAYIFGPLLFGWYGIFLGPMLLVLVVHFARLVLPELVAGVPIQPVAVDPSNVLSAHESGVPEPDASTTTAPSKADRTDATAE